MTSRLFAFAAVAALGACATVTRGTTNQMQIRSEPPGARVTTSLAHSCTTPCTFTVSRKDEFSMTFTLPGYRDERVEVKTRVAGEGVAGLVGNAIVGGIVGAGVDVATGSTLEHFPNPVVITLQPFRPEPPVARGRGSRPAAVQTRPPPAPAAAPPVDAPAPQIAPPAVVNPGLVPSSS